MHGIHEVIVDVVIAMMVIVCGCCFVDEIDDVIERVKGLGEFSLLGHENGVLSLELEMVLGGDVELGEE